MAHPIAHRTILAVLVLPMVIGGCGKRSGLDRGDAHEDVVARSESERAEPQALRQALGHSPGQFAVPPASEGHSSQANKRSTAPSADSNAAEVQRMSPPSAARGATPSVSGGKPPTLSSRGDSAYIAKPKGELSDSLRRERPGLATTWGEHRTSRVSTVGFVRDQPGSPAATQRIYYNNASGIAAQTGERSLASLGPNLTEIGRGFVTVQIVDPQGMALPGLFDGANHYVVGSRGARYAIRVQNHEGYRVEVVTTVDGLDVIDGTNGHFQKRGYVVEPYSDLLIEGFRKSSTAVASFRFGSVADSYAARTGNDRHVGVIGVAVFAERGCCAHDYPHNDVYRRETADPFPAQFARPPRSRLEHHAR